MGLVMWKMFVSFQQIEIQPKQWEYACQEETGQPVAQSAMKIAVTRRILVVHHKLIPLQAFA